jgi:ATP-dependent RNA helicase DDX51/DBP6
MAANSEQLFPALSEAEIKRRSEAERRLPGWLSHPIQFHAGNLATYAQNIEDFAEYIDQELISYIKINLDIHKLFPVQKCLIPILTKQFKSRPFRRPSDICVSSPTGSGKTLAYVVPIVNHLKQSLTRELRAVIVLPTRDLAQQVLKTFLQISQPTHLRCALATDIAQVFFRRMPNYSAQHIGHIRSLDGAETMPNELYSEAALSQDDFVSEIDILVSTPGTLVDLIQNSRGFTLRDLQILVIDEADRLMVSHKHDWLNTIEHAVSPKTFACPCKDPEFTHDRDILRTDRSNYFTANGCTMKNARHSRYIHKLLFSATLSSDPQILMHMNLFQPRLVLATKPSLTSTKIRNSLGTPASTPGGSPAPQSIGQYPVAVSSRNELLATTAIPDELDERMFITETKDKLYVMWYIMSELKYKKVLCFTSDKRKSYELFLFLNEINNVRAVNFSSDNKQELRQKYINEFKKGHVDVIVATDLCARGIDIDGVEYVISYDMPPSGTLYAHRVGRTARAGHKGTAITLVDSKQLVQFKKIIQQAHNKPNSMKLSEIVEEMKISHMNQKDERRDNYIKTYENYKDKLSMAKARIARHNKNKQ